MTQADLTKLAIAGAILFGAYKYGNGMVKAGAVAVAASTRGCPSVSSALSRRA